MRTRHMRKAGATAASVPIGQHPASTMSCSLASSWIGPCLHLQATKGPAVCHNSSTVAAAATAMALPASASLPLLVRPPARINNNKRSSAGPQHRQPTDVPEEAQSPTGCTVPAAEQSSCLAADCTECEGVQGAQSNTAHNQGPSLLQEIWPDYGLQHSGWHVPKEQMQKSWSGLSSGSTASTTPSTAASSAEGVDSIADSLAAHGQLKAQQEDGVAHLVAAMCGGPASRHVAVPHLNTQHATQADIAQITSSILAAPGSTGKARKQNTAKGGRRVWHSQAQAVSAVVADDDYAGNHYKSSAAALVAQLMAQPPDTAAAVNAVQQGRHAAAADNWAAAAPPTVTIPQHTPPSGTVAGTGINSSDGFATYLALSAMESALIAVSQSQMAAPSSSHSTLHASNELVQQRARQRQSSMTRTWAAKPSTVTELLSTARQLRAQLAQAGRDANTHTDVHMHLNKVLLRLLRTQQTRGQVHTAASWHASSSATRPGKQANKGAAIQGASIRGLAAFVRDFSGCMTSHTAAHTLQVLVDVYNSHTRLRLASSSSSQVMNDTVAPTVAAPATVVSYNASIDEDEIVALEQQQQKQADAGGSSGTVLNADVYEGTAGKAGASDMPKDIRILSVCVQQLLRVLLAGLSSSPPSTVVMALRALSQLPDGLKQQASLAVLQEQQRRTVGQQLVVQLVQVLPQLPPAHMVSALVAIARTGTGCRLLETGCLTQVLSHLEPALQASRPQHAASQAGLQPSQIATLGWALAQMGQTPPAAWRQVYAGVCALQAPHMKPAHLVQACSTLRAWQPAPQRHHHQHKEQQHTQKPQSTTQSMTAEPADLAPELDPARLAASREASAWPSSQLISALSGALLALLPAMESGQVAAAAMELTAVGWQPTFSQLRALQAHWEEQHCASSSAWPARDTSVLLAALAHSCMHQLSGSQRTSATLKSVGPSLLWLSKALTAMQQQLQDQVQTASSRQPTSTPCMRQQAALALCRVLAAVPHLLATQQLAQQQQQQQGSVPQPLLLSAPGASAARGGLRELHHATCNLLSTCATAELLSAAPDPLPVLRLLEGVSLLLGSQALVALPPDALPACESLLVSQAACVPGGAWPRLRDAYLRMGCAPGPQLEAVLYMHL